MTTPDVTRDGAPVAAQDPPAPAPRGVPPSSAALSSAWLLRAAAIAAVAAGVLGVVVAPGVRGNASEGVVVGAEWAADALSYFLAILVATLILRGALALARARSTPAAARVGLIAGGAAVVGLAAPSLLGRVPPAIAVLTAGAAAVTALAGAYGAARAPHTRAVAGVLFAFAIAAVARLGAWELATRAGDTANVQLFRVSQNLAKTGVLLEASGQVLAMMWLATRGRVTGQLASFAAMVGAAAVTWGVAHGTRSGAAPWEAIAHTALADAPGMPPPYGLDALATFLVPASLLLALVAAAQPGQVVAVAAAMGLALVSRGALDAPLRALCVVVAAQWATLACIDERAMWQTLVADREKKRSEEDS